MSPKTPWLLFGVGDLPVSLEKSKSAENDRTPVLKVARSVILNKHTLSSHKRTTPRTTACNHPTATKITAVGISQYGGPQQIRPDIVSKIR